MGFFDAPDAPSASSMTQAQTQANANQIGQSQAAQGNAFGPFQNIVNTFGEVDPVTGVRKLNTTTQLSPENQLLWAQLAGNRAGIGAGVGNLIGNYYNQLSTPPDLSNAAGSLTNQMVGNFTNYMDPYWESDRNFLENRLKNQGLTVANKGYQTANRQLEDNIARQRGNFINQVYPQAFQMAKEQYQTPINTIQSLMGLVGPYFGNQAGPTSFNAGGVDAAGNMQRAYQSQYEQYKNQMSGLGSLLTGLMSLPTGEAGTIGSMIGGGIGGLFSNIGGLFSNNFANMGG